MSFLLNIEHATPRVVDVQYILYLDTYNELVKIKL